MFHNKSRDDLSTIFPSAQVSNGNFAVTPLNMIWIYDLLSQHDPALLRYLFVKLSTLRPPHKNRSSVFRTPYEVIVYVIHAARCTYPVLLLRYHVCICHHIYFPPLLYPTFEKEGIGSNNILKPVSCAGYQQINKNLTSCKKGFLFALI